MNHKTLKAKTTLQKTGERISPAIQHYRSEATYPEQFELLSSLKHLPREAQTKLVGHLRADTWANYAAVRPVAIPQKIQRVTNWASALFAANSEQIGLHLELKKKIEICAFKGAWITARELLKSHHEAFGCSLWELQWQLVIADELEGESARRAIADEVARETGKSISGFLARLLAHRLERSIQPDILRKSIRSVCKNELADITALFILIALDESPDQSCATDLLGILECLPLIDHYHYFISTIAHLVATDHPDRIKLLRSLDKIRPIIDDHVVHMINELIDTNEIQNSRLVKEPYLKAWDSYFSGDYESAISICDELLISSHPDLNLLDLRVKSKMYADRPAEDSPKTPESQIDKILHQILSRGENVEEALFRLDQISLRYPFTSISRQSRALYVHQISPSTDKRHHRISSFYSPAHTPRLIEQSETNSSIGRYWSALHSRHHSENLSFLISLLEENPQNRQWSIPEPRQLFFRGLYSFRQGKLALAIGYLERFLELQRSQPASLMSPFAMEEAKQVSISVYEKTDNILEAQRLIIESFQECAQGIRRMPVDRIYQLAKSNKKEAGKSICYPILASLACTNPHEICMALKVFLKHQSASIPSQLFDKPDFEHSQSPLVPTLFLRVCIPEVLDSVRELNTQEKVESERLNLLKWISEKSPSLAHSSEVEKLKLIQESQLRAALDVVDESRVVLNLSSLREAEDEKLQIIHARYRSQKDLAMTQVTDEIQSVVAKIASGAKGLIIFDNAAEGRIDNSYAQSFKKVREIFLTSPHFGLEACLSARVRHGILIEHLLRPIKSRHLFTPKDSALRVELFDYWRGTCSGFSTESNENAKLVIEILDDMTGKLTAIASETKDVWIQSRTEEKNPNGLFDYAFSERELATLRQDDSVNDEDLEAYLDQIFLSLSSRTRTSLHAIRQKVTTQLRQSLVEVLDFAMTQIQAVGYFPSIRAALTNARHDSGIACDEMIRWFQKASGALMDDADFELICRTAIGMVERLHPEIASCHDSAVKSSFRVKGRHFTALVHVLFFLLENGVKHSNATPSNYAASLSVEADSNLLIIKVSNRMGDENDATRAVGKIRSRLEEVLYNLDPEKVVKEGGSGLAKVIAAFRYEFSQPTPKVTATAIDDQVVIQITAAMAGIAS